MLALEPEAASIYVKEMDLEVHKDLNESHLSAFSPGTKYMIVDLGGESCRVLRLMYAGLKLLMETFIKHWVMMFCKSLEKYTFCLITW